MGHFAVDFAMELKSRTCIVTEAQSKQIRGLFNQFAEQETNRTDPRPAVQFCVIPDKIQEAFYRLSDPQTQIRCANIAEP